MKSLNKDTHSMEQILEQVGFEHRGDPKLYEVLDHLYTVTHYSNEQVRILLNGPTGTGKELLAKAITRFIGAAPDKLVVINCANLDSNTAAFDLFGVNKKTYTDVGERKGYFELAAESDAVLFLDEVHKLHETVRAQLYRAIHERRFNRMGDIEHLVDFNGHVISAASSSIDTMRKNEDFPQDLFSRLASTEEIRIPSFADRTPEHRQYLVRYGLEHWVRKSGEMLNYDPGIVESLSNVPMPGNIRDLRCLLQQITAYARRKSQDQKLHITPEIVERVLKQSRWNSTFTTIVEADHSQNQTV